jgi:2-polyprenyl-6-methoxyphenol hydroxylase-like FAD-dependent oxidoreductase
MSEQLASPPKNKTQVLIVGGGPVGLSLAYLLGEQNIDVQVLERRTEIVQHYRTPHVAPSTIELWRKWGVFDIDPASRWEFDRYNGATFAHTLVEGEIQSLLAGVNETEFKREWSRVSPEFPVFAAGYATEKGLLAQVKKWPSVNISYGYEVRGIDPQESYVDLTVASVGKPDAPVETIRADYVLAADGRGSTIREALNVKRTVGPSFHSQISVTFHGRLDKYLADQRVFQAFITKDGARGYFSRRRPLENSWGFIYPKTSTNLPSEQEVIERIRLAVGDPGFEVKVQDIGEYGVRHELIHEWRKGRVFFVGDSSHSHSPWGGYGQNLGVHDANNLGWKLAAVLQGRAGDALLDTYHAERQYFALRVIKWATFFEQSYWTTLLGLEDHFRDFDTDHRASDDFLATYVATQRGYWLAPATLNFGARYLSTAVIPDDGPNPRTTAPDGSYVQSGAPGARAPHLWLKDRYGQFISTIQLFGAHFVLLADARSGWGIAGTDTASSVASVKVHEIGIGAEWEEAQVASWRDDYGVKPGGAVLVRPDGFVAARFAPSADPAGEVSRALGKVLGL